MMGHEIKIETLWQGKPLSDYSKDELIGIIELMAKDHTNRLVEHDHELQILGSPRVWR